MVAAAECRKNAGILSRPTALFTFREYITFIISFMLGVLKRMEEETRFVK